MAGSDISIHELSNGTLTENSLFPMAYMSGADYASGKISASELGEGLGTDIEYQSLNTGDKTLFGAINEINAIGGHSLAVTGTLTAGQTSITLSDSAIKTDSWLVSYASVFGVNCIDMVASNGSVTLTFEEQSQDIVVGVEIRGVSDGSGASFVSLKDNWAIGYSGNQKTKTNIDANNYVDVSGNVVTLKRTTNQYGLWIHTPQLEVGKSYMIAFDSFTGDDGNFYCDWSSDISATPITTQRWATIGCGQNGSAIKGIVFTAGSSAYYGIMLWSNSVSDIVATNPRMMEV